MLLLLQAFGIYLVGEPSIKHLACLWQTRVAAASAEAAAICAAKDMRVFRLMSFSASAQGLQR